MGAIRLDLGREDLEVWLETVSVEGASGIGYTGGGPRADRGESQIGAARLADAVHAIASALLPGTEPEEDAAAVTAVAFGLSVDATGRFLLGTSGTFRVTVRRRDGNGSET